MSHPNIFHTSGHIFALTLFFTLVGCVNKNDKSFIEGIQCNSNKNTESFVTDFSQQVIENKGFFTLKEEDGKLYSESYNPDLAYKDRNIKLSYTHDSNLLLVNEEVEDLTNLNSIVADILAKHLAAQGIQIRKSDIRKFSKENSGLVFEISEYSEKNNEISQKQSHSMLLLLKRLNCSIEEVRGNISKKVFDKEFQYIAEKEKELIRNIAPKIFYVFYFKNYKISVPTPAEN